LSQIACHPSDGLDVQVTIKHTPQRERPGSSWHGCNGPQERQGSSLAVTARFWVYFAVEVQIWWYSCEFL